MTRYLTNLAGLSFRPAEAKTVVKSLKVGDKLQLLRDPDNPHDATGSAIQIMVPTADPALPVFIGFVEALVNQPLAQELDDDFEYAATVSNIYTDYENGPQKGMWAKPLIEIVTSVKKNEVFTPADEPFDAEAAERELNEGAVDFTPEDEGASD